MPPPPAIAVGLLDQTIGTLPRRFAVPAQSFRSIPIPAGGTFWRKLAAFAGPGYLIAVGYMDPGNWATDLAGGSAYGYALISIVVFSSLLAMVLQGLSAKLGIATGLDLAQACRATYSPRVNFALWLICEGAIVACDLAEVLGTAIALNLLFGLPLIGGVLLTAFDVFLILTLQNRGFRKLEAFIVALLLIIGACFGIELCLSHPAWHAVLQGVVPSARIVTDPNMLYIAIGIVGATVMPHNLYLHSSIVQTRQFKRTVEGRREAVKLATLDSCIALAFALMINAAILILAASSFHVTGRTDITDLATAYRLLDPMLGASIASVLFAAALLAAGQNSTITGTMAGQIVAEGFLDLKLPNWLRRLVTRAMAIIPAVVVVVLAGESGASRLLIASQVVLSLQLPFAVVPLVKMTSDRRLMVGLVNPPFLKALAWTIAALLIALNLILLAYLVA